MTRLLRLFPLGLLLSACWSNHPDPLDELPKGDRGVLLLGTEGDPAARHAVVGVPLQVTVWHHDPEVCERGNGEECELDERTPLELIEARCLGGGCTVAAVDTGDDSQITFDVTALRGGEDTLEVWVRRTDTGAILHDSATIDLREVVGLAVQFDAVRDAGGSHFALLPGARSIWCAGLLDDAGDVHRFPFEVGDDLFTVAPAAGVLALGNDYHGLWLPLEHCTLLEAVAPGEALVTVAAGEFRSEVPLRVADPADVVGLDLRTRPVEDFFLGVAEPLADSRLDAIEAAPEGPSTPLLAVLTLADGAEAVAHRALVTVDGASLEPRGEEDRTLLRAVASEPGEALVTVTLGELSFTQDLAVVAP